MAGGMKVAVSPAVGPGPWGWGVGGGRTVRLLLILSGCLVYGTGTARAAAAKGAGAEGVIFGKGIVWRARAVILQTGHGGSTEGRRRNVVEETWRASGRRG